LAWPPITVADAVGVEEAGQQVVDGDVVPDGLPRESPATKPVRPAARAVGQAQHVDRRLHRAGGDVHDAAEAARDHAVHRRLDQLDGRQHVGVERLDPVLAHPLAEVARRRPAGVVHQDVRLRAGGERGGAAFRRGDVGGDGEHRRAGRD
jgi:hypothetical protein